MTKPVREEIIESIKNRKAKSFVKRKQFTKDIIDKETLKYFYDDLLMSPQMIGEKFNKTRQRIWQLLNKYKLYDNQRVTRVCVKCKKSFRVVRSRARSFPPKYCSDTCYHEHRQEVGNYNPSRQGQRIGRKVIEDWLGFKLPVGFVIHHEDGNTVNNEPENVFVFPSQSAHMTYHHAKRNGGAELPYQKMWELPGMIEEWLLEVNQ